MTKTNFEKKLTAIRKRIAELKIKRLLMTSKELDNEMYSISVEFDKLRSELE